jgi:hypothetical protein
MSCVTACNYYKHDNRYIIVFIKNNLDFYGSMCHSQIHGTAIADYETVVQ